MEFCSTLNQISGVSDVAIHNRNLYQYPSYVFERCLLRRIYANINIRYLSLVTLYSFFIIYIIPWHPLIKPLRVNTTQDTKISHNHTMVSRVNNLKSNMNYQLYIIPFYSVYSRKTIKETPG